MSIWTTFDGEIVLSGKKYDGKGFGLKSVWWDGNPTKGGTTRHYFTRLNDGKISAHFSRDLYHKAFKKMNVPHGSEGGSVIDILESKLDNKIHITFSRNLRGSISNEEMRDWVISFIKERQKEDWTIVRCNIRYGMDSSNKDRVYMSFFNQINLLEDRIVYKNNEEVEESWMHYLDDSRSPELIFEQEAD